MTFYNHIESVRCIAIDLTNGRKWRGASDKAVVFDALDAARREYMSLSDENAKLRKRITTQKQTIQSYRDESREWREVAERWREVAEYVHAENAKLRGQVADAHMSRLLTENESLRELVRRLISHVEHPPCEGCGFEMNCDGEHVTQCDEWLFMVADARKLGVEV